jgi:hypothetical protein
MLNPNSGRDVVNRRPPEGSGEPWPLPSGLPGHRIMRTLIWLWRPVPYDQRGTRRRRSGPARFRGTPEPLSALLRQCSDVLNAHQSRAQRPRIMPSAPISRIRQPPGQQAIGRQQAEEHDHQQQNSVCWRT